MATVTIVNYGLGNVQAFANIYKKINIDFNVASSPDELRPAGKIILPGVGSFDWAMKRLAESGMQAALEEMVVDKGIPVLGVCVGMQMMARKSDEGLLAGLGWIDGTVRKFTATNENCASQLPHMGWNNISPRSDNALMANFDEQSRFYFLHSYYFHCNNADDSIAVTNYGIKYTSAINHKNIYGVQFHPEKSHSWGIQLLKNFAEI